MKGREGGEREGERERKEGAREREREGERKRGFMKESFGHLPKGASAEMIRTVMLLTHQTSKTTTQYSALIVLTRLYCTTVRKTFI